MNDAFRDHVTSTGFVLTLGRTHIDSLVRLWWRVEASKRGYETEDDRGAFPNIISLGRFWIAAMGALQGRGLVWHKWENAKSYNGGKRKPWHQVWGFTPAGELVIDLLKEAGIWQEVVGTLPELPRKKRQRKAS